MEGPIEPPMESRDVIPHVPNIICLPVRGFRLKGTQIATMAGSGTDLDRVKTGPTRVTADRYDDHLNRVDNEFGSMACPVRSFPPIYLVQ